MASNTVRPAALLVIGSYHPSRQNTNTGVLTASMLESVFIRARELARREARCARFSLSRSLLYLPSRLLILAN